MNHTDPTPMLVSGLEQSRHALLKLAKTAQFLLQWFTADLEYLVTDNEVFIQTISQFCRTSRQSRVEILLHDPKTLMHRGHRLINLAQRLPSKVEIRCTNTDIVRQHPSSFLVVDREHFFIKPIASNWRGKLQFDAALEARVLLDIFEEGWETSFPDNQTRPLGI